MPTSINREPLGLESSNDKPKRRVIDPNEALQPDQFLDLLSELSGWLIQAPPQRMDGEIERVLERIVDGFCLDRSTVLEISEDRQGFRATHSFAAPDIPVFPRMEVREIFPHLVTKALEGEILRYSSLDDVPTHAAIDRQALQRHGQKSLLVFPYRVGGSYVGAVGFSTFAITCHWSDELVHRLQLVSMSIATALARKQADEAMQRSQGQLGEVQRIADLGTWENDLATQTMIGSRQLYRIFDIDRRSELEAHSLLTNIHPNDKERFDERMTALLDGNRDHFGSFRVIRGKGDIRHIQCWAELTKDKDGKPYRLLGVAQDVTDRRRAEEDLRQLSRRLIRAQEEERARIARELHDDMGQRMALLNMRIDMLTQSAASDPVAKELSDLSEHVGELASSVRKLSHALHPSALQHLGLVAAIDSLRREVARLHGLDIEFEHRHIPTKIPDEAALSLYRIAQEALRNVVKHSQSESASVYLYRKGGWIELEITDSGVGFDMDTQDVDTGIGVIGMRERLRLVDGTLVMKSSPGKGTTIKAAIPLHPGTRSTRRDLSLLQVKNKRITASDV